MTTSQPSGTTAYRVEWIETERWAMTVDATSLGEAYRTAEEMIENGAAFHLGREVSSHPSAPTVTEVES